MRIAKLGIKRRKFSRQLAKEDMRYLQKKISGRSVYRNLGVSYLRKPKHRKIGYQN